jgi:hypothetical protein
MFATLIEKSPFVLVAAVIDKAKLAAQHAAPPNPYHLALKFGLERCRTTTHARSASASAVRSSNGKGLRGLRRRLTARTYGWRGSP